MFDVIHVALGGLDGAMCTLKQGERQGFKSNLP